MSVKISTAAFKMLPSATQVEVLQSEISRLEVHLAAANESYEMLDEIQDEAEVNQNRMSAEIEELQQVNRELKNSVSALRAELLAATVNAILEEKRFNILSGDLSRAEESNEILSAELEARSIENANPRAEVARLAQAVDAANSETQAARAATRHAERVQGEIIKKMGGIDRLLSNVAMEEFVSYARRGDGHKIYMIRLVVRACGIGLKPAKDAVAAWWTKNMIRKDDQH